MAAVVVAAVAYMAVQAVNTGIRVTKVVKRIITRLMNWSRTATEAFLE